MISPPSKRGRKKIVRTSSSPSVDSEFDEEGITRDSSQSHTIDDDSDYHSGVESDDHDEEDDDHDLEDDDDTAYVGGDDDDDGLWGKVGKSSASATAVRSLSSAGGQETPARRGRPVKFPQKKAMKPKPDANAPSRAISCYHHFCKEVREELLLTRTDVSYPVIGQIAGERYVLFSPR